MGEHRLATLGVGFLPLGPLRAGEVEAISDMRRERYHHCNVPWRTIAATWRATEGNKNGEGRPSRKLTRGSDKADGVTAGKMEGSRI